MLYTQACDELSAIFTNAITLPKYLMIGTSYRGVSHEHVMLRCCCHACMKSRTRRNVTSYVAL